MDSITARIRQRFNRASQAYAHHAKLQQDTAQQLVALLDQYPASLTQCLDIGCGTGFVGQTLKQSRHANHVQRWINFDIAEQMVQQAQSHMTQTPWQPLGVCGDARQLPFASACIDTILSNLTLQWCRPLDQTLAELRRVLKPTGQLMITTLGEHSFYELRHAWQTVDHHPHVNPFVTMETLTTQLAQQDFKIIRTERRGMTLSFPSVLAIMQHLKRIGANTVFDQTQKGLKSKQSLMALSNAYPQKKQTQSTLIECSKNTNINLHQKNLTSSTYSTHFPVFYDIITVVAQASLSLASLKTGLLRRASPSSQ